MEILEARPRQTIEDYLGLPDDVRAELIDGVLYVTPAPHPRHQDVVANLHLLLAPHVRSRGLGGLWISPIDVVLPSGSIVQPDLLYVGRERLGIVRARIEGAPDLIVEVVSPSNPERDRFVKRDLYARDGVREYWIVDPREASIEVLVLAGNAWRPGGWFREGQALRSAVLEGLMLSLADVFRDPLAPCA